jgi:hypothetical protein
MGYYIRVLSKSDECPSFHWLCEKLDKADLLLVEGIDDNWTELTLQSEGTDIVLIDRVSTAPGTLGADEIEEFLEDLEQEDPQSAVEWLKGYLPNVKAIYTFQILDAIYERDGWNCFHKFRNALWNKTGGIIQADLEGFTNERGYHILWQFSESVTGDWWMAILENGDWKNFQMDLGNPEHRKAFKQGKVPPGISTI